MSLVTMLTVFLVKHHVICAHLGCSSLLQFIIESVGTVSTWSAIMESFQVRPTHHSGRESFLATLIIPRRWERLELVTIASLDIPWKCRAETRQAEEFCESYQAAYRQIQRWCVRRNWVCDYIFRTVELSPGSRRWKARRAEGWFTREDDPSEAFQTHCAEGGIARKSWDIDRTCCHG